MIESSSHRFEVPGQDSGVSLRRNLEIRTPSQDDKIHRKVAAILQGTSISLYYLKLSWKNKLKLVTELVRHIHSLETVKILLDTLYSTCGKITSYCLASPLPPIVFDKVLNDHDRMLEERAIEKTMIADLAWFHGLDDKDQVVYLFALIRYSGGALIRLVYRSLQDSYEQRIDRLRNRSASIVEVGNEENEAEEPTNAYEYDPEDPKHQAVLRLEKQWNETIAKYKKDIEKRMPKKQTDKGDKNDKKSKKSTKSKKKSKKGGKRRKDDDLDWIQIMPIWIVKKIFSYLDKSTLMKAKKVNEYWKWAIGELFKDQKIRKLLDKADKKLKESAGGDCTLPPEDVPEPTKPRVSRTARRLQKLDHRGAILESLRMSHLEAVDTSAIAVKVLKKELDQQHAHHLTIFPRVRRTAPPPCMRPAYVVKDLDIVCETRDDASEEETEMEGRTVSSSVTSVGSEDF